QEGDDSPRNDSEAEALKGERAVNSNDDQSNTSAPSKTNSTAGWHVSAGLQGSIERVMDTSVHAGIGLGAGLRRNDERTWFPLEFALELRFLGEIANSTDELTSRLAL